MNTSTHQNRLSLADLHLDNQKVQVWQAWLDFPEAAMEHCRALLSPDETARAGRFFFERDRRRYTAARALLRRLLGSYMGCPPEQVAFGYGVHGKPTLQPEQAESGLAFNVSHSGGLGVFAICLGQPLGVDVEQVRPMPDIDALAAQFFAPSEIDWLAAHQGQEKLGGFFKIWTAKEAFFKTSGDGLMVPISQAEIEIGGDLSPRLAAIAGDPSRADSWCILPFEPAPGYQAAIALEAHGWHVTMDWIPGG